MLPQQGPRQWPHLGPVQIQQLQEYILALKAAGRQEDPKYKTALELLHAQQRGPSASSAQGQGGGSGLPAAFNVAGSGSPLGVAPVQALGGRGDAAQFGNGPTRLGGSPEQREYVQGYDAAALQQRQNAASSQQMIDALRRRAAQAAQAPAGSQFSSLGQQQSGLTQQQGRQNQSQAGSDGHNYGMANAWGQGGAEGEFSLEKRKLVEQQEAARRMHLQKQGVGAQEEQGASNVAPAHLVSQFQKLLAEKQKMQMQQGLNQHAYNVQRELEARQAQRYEAQKMEQLLKQQLQHQVQQFNGAPAQAPAPGPFKPTAVAPVNNAALQQALKSRAMAPVKVEAQVQPPASTSSSRPSTPPAPAEEPHPSKKFTKGQLDTLKAQIMAFRRFKKGEKTLTPDILKAITPPPLSSNPNAPPAPLDLKQFKAYKVPPASVPLNAPPQKKKPQTPAPKPTPPPPSKQTVKTPSVQTTAKKPAPVIPPPQRLPPVRRFQGPLFDYPRPGLKNDNTWPLVPPPDAGHWGSTLPLSYDVRDLLADEEKRQLDKRRTERKAALERRLRMVPLGELAATPEQRTRLKVELKKLALLDVQGRVRDEVEEAQQGIVAMNERQYRKFVRWSEKELLDMEKQVLWLQQAKRAVLHKALFKHRKSLFEGFWQAREGRVSRNKGVAKYHEKMNKDFAKKKDEDRNRRMEALKANDVDQYRKLLEEQKERELPGDANERFAALSDFLSQTEDYLHKLGGKVSSVKAQQEREEVVLAAINEARAQGAAEEDATEAGRRAAEAFAAQGQDSGDLGTGSAAVNKYYNLAHTVTEQILRQPSMLRAGTLREYQMVGLQWMISLYNNKLNGILADEMGLGKTVQVMALIAYLMEFKSNKGPHLIIVPNAVMVNWKSEFVRWLPSVSVVVYVGSKDQRSRIFMQEVLPLKFNVLVTTYEFIMRDRSKLSKVAWKYIIIDEAQRMKDRESKLSRDLDRFVCQRRLLLTGTPLQNDLNELWALLNLLLPDVFDNSRQFNEWFHSPFAQQKDGAGKAEEEDWLETEKKIIVIHRLHQILEPFMLRRRVEDVEGSLPPKVSYVLKCKNSAFQSAAYDWIKVTGTIRLDPEDENMRVIGTNRHTRVYANLNNKVMELRKVCNHPYLNYPLKTVGVTEHVVRSCGKMYLLDRILVKLKRTGHRVLLFCTMTRLLDIVEEYCRWRRFQYRRIDGTTSLDDREDAIVDFNRPDSEVFIFLLSIRAAGRGLNLQTADTVVVYDPDPNPKNEEQAVARAHRIGQTKEVRVFYMEAVADGIPFYEMEDKLAEKAQREVQREESDDEDERPQYVGSIETLVREQIQQHKIDMADEVINAGRFDQRTTQEERRITLEALLHDEDRYQRAVHDVPSMSEINRMIARTDDEVELFDKMDEEEEWPRPLLTRSEIPAWLKSTTADVDLAMNAKSKEAIKRGLSESIAPPGSEVTLGRGHRQANKLAALTEEEPSSQALPRDDEDEEALYGEEEDTWKKAVPEDEEEPSMKRPPEEEEPEPSISIPPPMNASAPEPEDFDDDGEETRSPAVFIGPGGIPRSGKRSPAKRSRSSLGKKSSVGGSPGARSSPGKEASLPGGLPIGGGAGKGVFKAGKSRLGLERFQEKDPASEPEEGEIKGEDSAEEGEVLGHSRKGGLEVSWGDITGALQPPQKAFGGKGFMGALTGGDSRDGFGPLAGGELEEGEIEEGEIPAEEFGGRGAERVPLGEERNPLPEADEQKRKKKKRKREAVEEKGKPEGGVKKITLKLPGKLSAKAPASSKANGLRSEKSVKRSRVSDYTEILGLKPKPEQKLPAAETPVQRLPVEEPLAAALAAPPSRSNGQEGASDRRASDGRVLDGPSGRRMPEDVKRKCQVVLEKLRTAKDKEGRHVAAALLELPSERDYPDYYRIVRTPIDLAAIEARLAGDGYPDVAEFAQDVDLMLENAQLYHKKGSQVFSDARKLQKLFFQRMEVTFPEANLGAARGVNKGPESGGALVGASERPGVVPVFLKPEEKKPVVPSSKPESKPPATEGAQTKGFRTSYAGNFNQAGQPILGGGVGKVRIRVRTGGAPAAPKVEVVHAPVEQPKLVESVSGPPKGGESARPQHFPTGSAKISLSVKPPREDSSRPVHPGDLVVVKKKRRSKEEGGKTPREVGNGGSAGASLPSEGLLGFRPPKKMRSERRPTH